MIRLQELELVFGQTDNGRTNGRTNGWTDKRDVGNSILDSVLSYPRLSWSCDQLQLFRNGQNFGNCISSSLSPRIGHFFKNHPCSRVSQISVLNRLLIKSFLEICYSESEILEETFSRRQFKNLILGFLICFVIFSVVWFSLKNCQIQGVLL